MTAQSSSPSPKPPPRETATPNLDDRSLPSYRGKSGWLIFLWDCLRFGILPTLAARKHARNVLAKIDADVQAEYAAEQSAEPAGEESTEQKIAAELTAVETKPAEITLPPVDGRSGDQPAELVNPVEPAKPTKPAKPAKPAKPKRSFMSRLRVGMSRSNSLLTDELRTAGRGLSDEILEELEMRLVSADVGIATTTSIIAEISQKNNDATLLDNLKAIVAEKLAISEQRFNTTAHSPFVLLMVGVNGVGKTTTIGKLAKKFQQQGQSVMLAAGDTFRAAAVEQLKTWGERNDVPVVAQAEGSDSASVIFDAFESAKAKQVDVLIADTAGRLHTQSNLMDELKKIVRVLKKLDETAPHEVMLVVDGGTGQNALSQAKQFQQAVDVSGVTVTKLDGTAKGGIIVAIADQLQIPIRFVGVGEGVDDLGEFNAEEFAQALVGE